MNANASNLHAAMRTLRVHFDEARSSWDDRVSRDFEERHLDPLETQVQATIRAMEHLGEVLSRVRHECS